MGAEIVFSLFLGFISGVIANGSDGQVFMFALGFLILSLTTFFLRRGLTKYILLALLAFFAGFFYFSLFSKISGMKYPPLGEKLTLEVIVVGESRISGGMQRTKGELLAPYGGTIDIVSEEGILMEYGDRLKFQSTLQEDKYSTRLTAKIFSVEVVSKRNGSPLKQTLLDFKSSVLRTLKQYLSPPSAGLMGGLLLGERNGFSEQFKLAMKNSGTTHLVALSGYNISILVIAISFAFAKVFSRRARFILSLSIIFLFILMVGAEASVVRAGIMGALVLFAKESGRSYSPRHAIAFAGFAMTVWDPNNVFDIGFILSFVSLLGIVYVLPAVKNIFLSGEKPEGVFDAMVTTISAQAAVLPIAIKTFGSFSLSAIISNSLILIFVPFSMLLGLMLAVAGFISGGLAFFIAFFSEAILRYFIFVIELFAKIRLPFGDFLNLPYASAIYYFLLIIFIYVGTSGNKK